MHILETYELKPLEHQKKVDNVPRNEYKQSWNPMVLIIKTIFIT